MSCHQFFTLLCVLFTLQAYGMQTTTTGQKELLRKIFWQRKIKHSPSWRNINGLSQLRYEVNVNADRAELNEQLHQIAQTLEYKKAHAYDLLDNPYMQPPLTNNVKCVTNP